MFEQLKSQFNPDKKVPHSLYLELDKITMFAKDNPEASEKAEKLKLEKTSLSKEDWEIVTEITKNKAEAKTKVENILLKFFYNAKDADLDELSYEEYFQLFEEIVKTQNRLFAFLKIKDLMSIPIES